MQQPSNDQRRQRLEKKRKRVKQSRRHAKVLRQWLQREALMPPLRQAP